MKKYTAEIKQELQRLSTENRYALAPSTVVEAAKDPSSVLHEHFTWDDTEAAVLHRLHEASQLIRYARIVVSKELKEPQELRARVTAEPPQPLVLRAPKELSVLEGALEELQVLRKRYGALKELSGVFVALDAVVAAQSMPPGRRVLHEAAQLAVQLEREQGMSRHDAATRASAQFKLPKLTILEAIRQAS